MTTSAILLITANAIAFACPATIVDKQAIVSPRTYETRVDKFPRHLDMVRIYSDRPETLLQLAPDSQSHPDRNTWDFGPRGGNAWIECTYKRSAVSLRHHIPNARRCVFVHNSTSGGDKRKGYCERVAP